MENQPTNSKPQCCPENFKKISSILALILVIGAVVVIINILPKIVPQSIKNILPKGQVSQVNSKVEKLNPANKPMA